MRTAIVIPVGPGRLDNLLACLDSLRRQTVHPELLVMVGDGPEATRDTEVALDQNRDHPIHEMVVVEVAKHEPGMEQPRNRGVRKVEQLNGEVAPESRIDTVWFLDSDILVAPEALAAFDEAMGDAKRILVGPYDWLPAGLREPAPELKNDPRWVSFDEHDRHKVLVDDLSAGLACFSGNLVWPIDEFTRIGGFWNALHHGRCEDGELGLRAVACGVPISFVAAARGWHLDHPINFDLTIQRNERDVPMLNERHPWVQGEGLFVVEEDGKRFNVRCACGWEGNTAEIWNHQATCEAAR